MTNNIRQPSGTSSTIRSIKFIIVDITQLQVDVFLSDTKNS